MTDISKNKVGRPSLIESEEAKELLNHVNAGAPLKLACQASGIEYETLMKWRSKARKGEEPYLSFVKEMEKRSAIFQMTQLATIGNDDDWRARRYHLEALNPDMFYLPRIPETKQELDDSSPVIIYKLPDNGVPLPRIDDEDDEDEDEDDEMYRKFCQREIEDDDDEDGDEEHEASGEGRICYD